MNDCISCQSNGNLNNHRSRDEEMQTCHKQGKKDICEACHFFDESEQIDVCKFGIGIFDYQIYLCRIYRVNESCIEGSYVI